VTSFLSILKLDNFNYPLATGFDLRVITSIAVIVLYLMLIFISIKKMLKYQGDKREGKDLNLLLFFMLFFILTLFPVLQINFISRAKRYLA